VYSPRRIDGAGGLDLPLLQVEELRVEFGGIVALSDLSFSVEHGQICALIGPNGAGKTTLFNCVSRLYQATAGSIRFDGRDLTRMPPHRIARLGIARTFQNLALFPAMTVLENVMTGAHAQGRAGALQQSLWSPRAFSDERSLRDEAHELLSRLQLDQYADRHAAALPYGTLKRIEIARALAARPRLLMLDEPAAGLTHSEVDELGDTIRALRDEFELTVLLVEHHMAMVMSISDHVVVLDFGSKIAEGAPVEIRDNPLVIEAYLGTAS
jgi:branched-chain amino acid transport system ATP-binding protein